MHLPSVVPLLGLYPKIRSPTGASRGVVWSGAAAGEAAQKRDAGEFMRIETFATAAIVLALFWGATGCAKPHMITLRDGQTMETKDEPSLNPASGFYEFKDESGKKIRLNKDEIRKIESK